MNGKAIFGSRYWIRAEDLTPERIRVRYTTNKGKLYAILLDEPTFGKVTIPGIILPKKANITMLGVGGKLKWQQYSQNLSITLPDKSLVKKSPAYTLEISCMPL